MNKRSMILRFVLSAAVYLCAMSGLGFRLALLHLGPNEDFRAQIRKNRQIEKKIKVVRGNIYDCTGHANILAMDLAVRDVCVDPTVVASNKNFLAVVSLLSEELALPSDEVAVRVNRPKRLYERIKRDVPQDETLSIEEKKLKGIFFRDKTCRYYPQGSFLCHVLGFVNDEGVGSAGIEQEQRCYLKGSPGFIKTQVDVRRHEVYGKRGECKPGFEGAAVQLTIDQNIQHMVEKALDGIMEEHNAKGAWSIVQRVQTGEILAMASRPAYDPNEFQVSTPNQRLNRAIGYVYEPGSTFKAVAFAGALNEGIVTRNTIFNCENGSWLHERRTLRDFHAYGDLNVADGLKKSSNILSAKVALALGEEKFYRYLKSFSIGSSMGIDLPGEEVGILLPVEKWPGIKTSRIAIGQGVAVTALQMLGVYSAIANDGYLMKPYIVKRVVNHDGSLLYDSQPEVLSKTVSPETARLMCRLLHRVTEEGGTGKRARVEGFEVAGKTGTAQKAVAGGYSQTLHVGSFVGFLPARDPELSIIVVVDEPHPIHFGGVVAAPAFSLIAEEAVRYLGITPAGSRSRMAGFGYKQERQ